jgi:hypothetical protein
LHSLTHPVRKSPRSRFGAAFLTLTLLGAGLVSPVSDAHAATDLAVEIQGIPDGVQHVYAQLTDRVPQTYWGAAYSDGFAGDSAPFSAEIAISQVPDGKYVLDVQALDNDEHWHVYRAQVAVTDGVLVSATPIVLERLANVSGVIRDLPAGEPAEIEVWPWPSDYSIGWSRESGAKTTDEGNEYFARGLPPGSWKFDIKATTQTRVYVGSAPIEVIGSVDLVNRDISVSPLPNVAGLISGLPEGAEVRVTATPRMGGEGPRPVETVAGADGNAEYLLLGGRTGAYVLEAAATDRDGQKYTGSAELWVRATDVIARPIAMVSAGAIAVTVAGLPATETRVELQLFPEDSLSGTRYTAQQDVSVDEGAPVRHTFEGVPAGRYRLGVAGSASSYWATGNVSVVSGGLATSTLSTTPPNALSGVVTDSSGRPLAGAEVSFSLEESLWWVPPVTSEVNGSFRFPAVKGTMGRLSGSYDLESGDGSTTTLWASVPNRISLTFSTTQNLEIPIGSGSIYGIVTDRETGIGLRGVDVSGYSWGPTTSQSASTTTDSAGRYRLSGLPVEEVTYLSMWNGADYVGIGNYGVLVGAASPTKERNFTMAPPTAQTGTGVVRGRVTEAASGDGFTSGAPIAGAEIYIFKAFGPSAVPAVFTDELGNFEVTGLTQGEYYIYTYDYFGGVATYKPSSMTLVSVNDDPVTQNFALERYPVGTSAVTGLLRDSTTNQPVAGAYVYLYSEQGGSYRSARTDEQGIWSASGLSSGRWQVSFYTELPNVEWAESVSFEVPEGDNVVISRTDEVRSIIPGSSEISGHLRDALSYVPVPNAEVEILRLSGGLQPIYSQTDADGFYRVPNLPDGRYIVGVLADGYIADRLASGWDEYGRTHQTVAFLDLGKDEKLSANARLNPVPKGFATIDGTVSDSSGTLIPDAYVWATSLDTAAYQGWTLSGDDGRFVMQRIRLGTVELTTQPQSAYGDVRWAQSSMNVPLTVDGETIRPRLTAYRAATITGTIRAEDGLAPPCVLVTAWRKQEDGSVKLSGGTIASTASNSPGQYSLNWLAPGEYVIHAQPDCTYFGNSYAGARVLGDAFWMEGNVLGSTVPVSVVEVAEEGEVDGIDITLRPGGSISGTISVQAANAEVAPLPPGKILKLTVFREGGGEFLEQPQLRRWVSANAGGEFTIAGLAHGRYKVKIEDTWAGNRGYQTAYSGGSSTLEAAESLLLDEAEPGATMNVTLTSKVPVGDPTPASESQIVAPVEDQVSAPDEIQPGQTITVDVGIESAGEYVSTFIRSTPRLLGTWTKVAADGTVSATVPSDMAVGSHRMVVQDADNQVVGWTSTIVSRDGSGPGGRPDPDRPSPPAPNPTPGVTAEAAPALNGVSPSTDRPKTETATSSGVGESGQSTGEPDDQPGATAGDSAGGESSSVNGGEGGSVAPDSSENTASEPREAAPLPWWFLLAGLGALALVATALLIMRRSNTRAH